MITIPVTFTYDEAEQVIAALKSREKGLRTQDAPQHREDTISSMTKIVKSIASERLREDGQRRIHLETPPAFRVGRTGGTGGFGPDQK